MSVTTGVLIVTVCVARIGECVLFVRRLFWPSVRPQCLSLGLHRPRMGFYENRMVFGIGSSKLGESARSVTLRFVRTCRRTHERVNNV